MIRRAPRSTSTDTLYPYTPLVRSEMVDAAATREGAVARAAYEPIGAAAAKKIVTTGPAIGVAVDTIAIVVGRAEQNIFEGADFGVAVMDGDPIGIVEVHALVIGIGHRAGRITDRKSVV